MSHNVRIRADLAGGANPWVMGKPVTGLELEDFDDAQYASVNGDAGGVWSPPAPIIIGGAGLKTLGPATISDCESLTIPVGNRWTFVIGSLASLVGTLTFASGSEAFFNGITKVNSSGLVQVDGGATIKVAGGATWTLNGNISGQVSYGTLTNVSNGSAVGFASGSTLAFQSGSFVSSSVGGTVSMNGTTAFSSTSVQTLECLEDVSGTTATTGWRTGVAPDANTSFDVSKDLYAGTPPTANRIYTLLDATATVPTSVGMVIRFSISAGGSHGFTWIREDGSTVAAVASTALAGARVSFIYRDSAWHCLSWIG